MVMNYLRHLLGDERHVYILRLVESYALVLDQCSFHLSLSTLEDVQPAYDGKRRFHHSQANRLYLDASHDHWIGRLIG
jgi:hypothetical protein